MVPCSCKRKLLQQFRKGGDLTPHWEEGDRFLSKNRNSLWRSSKKMQVTLNGLFFAFNKPPVFEADHFDPVDAEQSESSSSSSDSSESSSSPSVKATRRDPKTIPDSFDEIAMGVFRQTWHVVMNPQTEEGLPPDFKWTTACGRRFHPDSFSIRDELALTAGHVLCAHPGCKKGWISVGILQ